MFYVHLVIGLTLAFLVVVLASVCGQIVRDLYVRYLYRRGCTCPEPGVMRSYDCPLHGWHKSMPSDDDVRLVIRPDGTLDAEPRDA